MFVELNTDDNNDGNYMTTIAVSVYGTNTGLRKRYSERRRALLARRDLRNARVSDLLNSLLLQV